MLHFLNSLRTAVLLLAASSFLQSCSPRGCDDPAADNYEPKALKPCDCCKYSAKVVFWYKEAKYRQFESAGAKYLVYKANGVVSGKGTSLDYYTSSPPSNPNNDVSEYSLNNGSSALVFLGSQKTSKVLLSCEDQNHTVFWTDSVLLKTNEPTVCEIR